MAVLHHNKPRTTIPKSFFMILKSYTLINVESVQVLRLISLENFIIFFIIFFYNIFFIIFFQNLFDPYDLEDPSIKGKTIEVIRGVDPAHRFLLAQVESQLDMEKKILRCYYCGSIK